MRTIARRLALPTTALVAALALTACQSDGTQASAASAPISAPAPTSAPASASPASPASAKPTADASTPSSAPASPAPTTPSSRPTAPHPTAKPASRPGTRPAPRRTADTDPAGTTPCTTADTRIVASKVSRPVNHLVLTVTNVGSRPCNALDAPSVGFDDPQAPLRVVEDSKPQAVVTLAPGESGYASVILTGEPGPDTHGRTVRTITVYLTSDSGKTVTAPSGTFADDGAAVSYWQHTLEEALTY